MFTTRFSIFAALTVTAINSTALAQGGCAVTYWDNTYGVPGFDLGVLALANSPDYGLVAGGAFVSSGSQNLSRAAYWSFGWQPFTDNGVNGTSPGAVEDIVVLPSNAIVMGGQFVAAGGATMNNITAWDPSTGSWVNLSGGRNGVVISVAALSDDTVLAGGLFQSHISAWQSGGGWSTVGLGTNGPVHDILVLPDDTFFIAGEFTLAGSLAVNNIAYWDGTTWSALGSGLTGGTPAVFALGLLSSGEVVAGGQFTHAGGNSAANIAKWDGSSWSNMGSGVSSGSPLPQVRAIGVMPNDDVVAGGFFGIAGGTTASNIAVWNGSAWSALGVGTNDVVDSLLVIGGNVVVGGAFSTAGGLTSNRIASFTYNSTVACYADCDGSGVLDIDDFICFQTYAAINDPYADCDCSGTIDIDDAICFQTLFALGC